MSLKNLILAAITIILALVSDSEAYFEFCASFKKEQKIAARYFDSVVAFDLLQFKDVEADMVLRGWKGTDPSFLVINNTIDVFQRRGVKNPSMKEIRKELNEQTLKLIEAYRPFDPTDKRLDFLTIEIVQAVLDSIEKHEVTKTDAMGKYNQQGTDIGFCFGRGTYVDMMLMRLGVDRDSIKKIWVVGNMQDAAGNWQFHIGTMVRLKDGRWVVIDNVAGRIVEARDWYKIFLDENPDKELRLYVSSSDKFTPSLGKYDPVQMGRHMVRNQDWYKGYFEDLFEWFESKTDLQLSRFLGIEFPQKPIPDRGAFNFFNDDDRNSSAQVSRRTILQREYGTTYFIYGNLEDEGPGARPKLNTIDYIRGKLDRVSSWWRRHKPW